MELELAAVSLGERRVMLSDGTLLLVRSLLDDEDQEVSEINDATQIVVVDHRVQPPPFYVIRLDAIEYSPEA